MSRDVVNQVWETQFGRLLPDKVVCVGLNYRDHAAESGADLPREPLFFAKFANTICGPGDPIVLPPEGGHVDAEAELAIVIGQTARRVSMDAALDVVAGYTVANDVSARGLQLSDGQWFRGKSFDTFCPLMPDIVPVSELGDASDLRIVQRLNGEVLQDSRTSQLIFGVREIVARATVFLTLEPGDLILTGTPAGVGIFRDPKLSLRDGDMVEIQIENIGTLENPVIAE